MISSILSGIQHADAALGSVPLRAVAWLRTGYPDVAPKRGYLPLIALYGSDSLVDDD
jgi:hypothetical protein